MLSARKTTNTISIDLQTHTPTIQISFMVNFDKQSRIERKNTNPNKDSNPARKDNIFVIGGFSSI